MIIKPKSNKTKGIILSSFMALALVAQPFYGVVAGSVANAEEVTTTNTELLIEPAKEAETTEVVKAEEPALPVSENTIAENSEGKAGAAVVQENNKLVQPALLGQAAPAMQAVMSDDDATVATEEDLRGAIATGKTNITLSGVIGINKQITINKSITFNGGTIKSLTAGKYGEDDAVVYVRGTDTVFTANGTVFDGNKKAERQGVKVYGGAKTFLNNVTIKNATKAGLHVNGESKATVNTITTSNNGANFGGLVVSGGGEINIDEKSTHDEPKSGFIIKFPWDARIDGSGMINDNSGQYTPSNFYGARKLINNINAPAVATPTQNQTLDTNDVAISWNAIVKTNRTQASVSYNYKIDNGTPVNTTATSVTPNLANGTHTVAVQAVSASGLVSAWSAVRTFTVKAPDAVAPESSVVKLNGADVTPNTTTKNCVVPGNFYPVKGEINFSSEFRDSGSGMSDVQYTVRKIGDGGCSLAAEYDSGYKQMTQDGDTFSAKFDTTNVKNESWEYVILMVGKDKEGNKAERNIGITVDNTAPKITVKEESKGNHDEKIFREVSFKLFDAVAIDRAELNEKQFTSNRGSVWGDFDNVWANRGWSGAQAGENTLVLYDKAGNSSSYEFFIDAVAPTITHFDLIDLKDGKFNPSKVIAHAKDGETVVTSVSIDTYKLVEGVWKYTFSPFVQGTPMIGERNFAEFGADNPRIKEDGEYKLVAWATDKAGNVSETKTSDVFTVDNTNPAITLTNNYNGFVSIDDKEYKSWKDARNVNVTIEDANVGITKLYRDSDNYLVQEYKNDGTEFSLAMGLPEGVYYLVHTDKAGNDSDKKYFAIANKRPVIIDVTGLSNSDNIISSNHEVSFNANNGDSIAAIGEVMVRVWDKNGKQAAPNLIFEINDDGKYVFNLSNLLKEKFVDGAQFTIRIQAKNTSGVHSYLDDKSDKYFIIVDTSAPEITVSAIDEVTEGSATTIKGRVKGTNLDDTVTVTVNGKVHSANLKDDGTFELILAGEDKLPVGSHEVTVIAKNKAGKTVTNTGAIARVNQVTTPTDNNNTGTDPTDSTTTVTNPTATRTTANTLAIQTTTNPTATTEDATVNGEEEVLGTSTERERSASVLAATDDKTGSDNEWSIVNAIAAVITVLISIIALAGISKKQGKGKTLSAVTAIPAIGSVVAFFMLENLSSPMIFLNAWSWLFVGILAAQVFILAMTKQKNSDNE